MELLDLVGIAEPSLGAVVTDLGGNVLWTYNPPLPGSPQVNPIKLLANGHFLVGLSAQPDGTSSLIQEIDLSGQVIWRLPVRIESGFGNGNLRRMQYYDLRNAPRFRGPSKWPSDRHCFGKRSGNRTHRFSQSGNGGGRRLDRP